MNKLNLKNINLQAPYTVHEREDKQHEFYKYVLKTAEGKLEGQDNFMALIAQVDNPRLAQAIEEFEETADILFGPPAKQHLSFWEKCIEFVYKVVSKII